MSLASAINKSMLPHEKLHCRRNPGWPPEFLLQQRILSLKSRRLWFLCCTGCCRLRSWRKYWHGVCNWSGSEIICSWDGFKESSRWPRDSEFKQYAAEVGPPLLLQNVFQCTLSSHEWTHDSCCVWGCLVCSSSFELWKLHIRVHVLHTNYLNSNKVFSITFNISSRDATTLNIFLQFFSMP